MKKSNYTRMAELASAVLHPFMQPIYFVLLLVTGTAFALYPPLTRLYVVGVVALYTFVLPLLALMMLMKWGLLTDLRVEERKQRTLPLLIGAVCYVLCALTIGKMPSAYFIRKFLIAAACCEMMCLLVSTRYKISLHLTGMGGLTAMLTLLNFIGIRGMFVPLVVAVVLSGVLASARLFLGCHRLDQILAGWCGGFVTALLSVLLL